MRFTMLLLLCIGTAGCGENSVDVGLDGELMTDKGSYTVTPVNQNNFVVNVTARFKNTMGRTVYIPRCDSDDTVPLFTVHKASTLLADDVLTPAFSCPGGVAGLAVPPNEEREYPLLISYQVQAGAPVFVPGDYVIGFELLQAADARDGKELFSNPFRLNSP